MALTHYACHHCGGWILWFDSRLPVACPNCTDVRNALPEEDFTYLPIDQAAGQYRTKWQETLPGLWEFWTEPQLGLGSHGWLLQRPEGNIAFEAAPYYDEAARAQLTSLGGVSILSSSHPHGYGALWQLQEFFDPELIIHKDDLQYTKAFRVNHPIDDFHRIDTGYEMLRLGGHYEGQTALYDRARRILFLGDALKIDFDAQGVPVALSCHKGYHYAIPLTRDELLHYRDVFSRFDFAHVCTPFELGRGVDRSRSIALIDYLLTHGIHTSPVPLTTLQSYVQPA
ncbi:hypothetical protein LEM8419_01593 [Neolewinella maritima]|uniref:Metallo-beta-lactamase domain-containing protein n=1 Tax=Neolewinella maritima TaxID=1383882 RepID=A0ABN8F3S3_9BACT|nr:hypothetical protein [Neolewinella maritima]CAH1000440.1 hypothetical protein LEM8419_01593 [Neolewinella maritima]